MAVIASLASAAASRAIPDLIRKRIRGCLGVLKRGPRSGAHVESIDVWR